MQLDLVDEECYYVGHNFWYLLGLKRQLKNKNKNKNIIFQSLLEVTVTLLDSSLRIRNQSLGAPYTLKSPLTVGLTLPF